MERPVRKRISMPSVTWQRLTAVAKVLGVDGDDLLSTLLAQAIWERAAMFGDMLGVDAAAVFQMGQEQEGPAGVPPSLVQLPLPSRTDPDAPAASETQENPQGR
jgi:hypothetical protein